jgi:predicted amidohydrolase
MKTTGFSRKELLVAVAQWLAVPGDPDANLEAAIELIEQAGASGADIVVLPELWPCGYDIASLHEDVRAAAESLGGPRTNVLADLARRLHMWIFAGSVPELSGGQIYNTAVVFNRSGALVATHRKVHLYHPTGEHEIFAPGTELTSFVDDELGHVGVTVCFDGDFPETARALGERGADLIVQANAYEWEARSYWDLLYPAAALANAQWWVMANQCGTTSSGTCLGASMMISPAGEILAEARRAAPGENPEPELLLCLLSESTQIEEARVFAQLLREGVGPA